MASCSGEGSGAGFGGAILVGSGAMDFACSAFTGSGATGFAGLGATDAIGWRVTGFAAFGIGAVTAGAGGGVTVTTISGSAAGRWRAGPLRRPRVSIDSPSVRAVSYHCSDSA